VSKKVRVYVLSLVGSNQELFLRADQLDYLAQRVADLRKGQKLTVRVTDMTPEAVQAEKPFDGW
jgi:hypothetical protein